MRYRTWILAISSMLAVPGSMWAQSAVAAVGSPAANPPKTESAADPGRRDPAVVAVEHWALGLSHARLENGLRVVMSVDAQSPTVAVCVTYDVGSRNETAEQDGFAHLFEHMMFQGSRNVAKGRHFELVTARGGSLNGTTSADRTNYFESLPTGELDLALWLEADRMRWLNVTRKNFENQRAVVEEEFRMRVTNAAYQPALIKLERMVYAGYPPYEHPTIGSMAALEAAKLEWVQKFHERYYVPSNAVISIVGGFDPDAAMTAVHRYFDQIPSPPPPEYQPPALPPLPTAERQVELKDANAKTPALLFGWRIPAAREPDHYPLELVTRILADGESSVLRQKLVRERALAQDVSAWTTDHRGPDSLVVTVELSEHSSVDAVRSVVDRELQRLATKGPSAAELARAKQRAKSDFVFGLQSNTTKATTLGEYEVFYGDGRLIARDLEKLLVVTPADVASAVRRHLSRNTRSVVTVMPTDAASTTRDAGHSEESQP